jgi:uncharacterized membrane protein
MKRYYTTTLLIVLAAFLISSCCGMPKKSVSTVANAGFIKIIADPESADVYVNDAHVGKASEFNGKKQVLELSAGRYKIELKAEGYYSYSRDMMVGAGATEDLKVTLEKK